jgi:hypothetical protein
MMHRLQTNPELRAICVLTLIEHGDSSHFMFEPHVFILKKTAINTLVSCSIAVHNIATRNTLPSHAKHFTLVAQIETLSALTKQFEITRGPGHLAKQHDIDIKAIGLLIL